LYTAFFDRGGVTTSGGEDPGSLPGERRRQQEAVNGDFDSGG